MLHPALEERDYLTQIHHINGQGEDGGEMYLELKVKD